MTRTKEDVRKEAAIIYVKLEKKKTEVYLKKTVPG